MLLRVGVSCRILSSIVRYLYISYSGSLPRLGKRERVNLSAIVFFCNYAISIRKGLFLL